MKNYNRIHRNEGVSSQWCEVHTANNVDFNPSKRNSRRGGVLASFLITHGINKKEYANFNEGSRYRINRQRCLIDYGICYDET